MPSLVIQKADGTRQSFPLEKDRITLGRSRDSDVFLPDQWLSRHHAEIRRAQDSFVLADLGSKNGTLLNGQQVNQGQRLRDGDVIALGELRLTFTDSQEPEPEEEAPEGTRMFSVRELADLKTEPVDQQALQRQNRVLRVLSGAAQQLLGHRPLPELFEQILNLLFEAVPAERGAILLREGENLEVKASRSRKGGALTKISRSIAKKTVDECRALLIPNILEDASFRTQDSILTTGIRSAVTVPLWYSAAGQQDAVIGLVYLDSFAGAHSFTEDDLQMVSALANVAAAKIENSRLLEESLEKRAMEADMKVAADIQRGLLPGAPAKIPGYGVAGINFPCRAIGGDYYDFALQGDRLLFALGDVSGKGTGAALLMAVLRAAVRAHWEDYGPAEAVARINRTVCQNVPPNKFITFFLGCLDPASGRVSYVNAGHNPPILARADGSYETLAEGGVVLGLFESPGYAEGSTELRPGDVLVVFSDGITETWTPEDEEFGEDHLTETVVKHRDLDAAALQAEILRTLDAFAAGAKATDDRTLIVLKRES